MNPLPEKNEHAAGILNKNNFHDYCRKLAEKEKVFQNIIAVYGLPELWSRPPGFASLIHIILEQQVSLASARAAFDQLNKTISPITPENILTLSDEVLKACYFSRQKIKYARALATAIVDNKIDLQQLSYQPAAIVRAELTKINGIGNWTADIYLLFVLQHADIFPTGDLAMMNALKTLFNLPINTSKEAIENMAECWRPYRSVAAMLCWHWYIKTKKINPPY